MTLTAYQGIVGAHQASLAFVFAVTVHAPGDPISWGVGNAHPQKALQVEWTAAVQITWEEAWDARQQAEGKYDKLCLAQWSQHLLHTGAHADWGKCEQSPLHTPPGVQLDRDNRKLLFKRR
jgi:hypothetical protein